MQVGKGKHLKKKGGKFFPTLCRKLGNFVLVLVILGALPLTLPRLLGYEIFAVVSGSMEPALPAGSLVYVKRADPTAVTPGQIIAFRDEGETVTHRVVENRTAEGSFITRGDANETDDLFPVSYWNLIGLMRFHVPALGTLMLYFTGAAGKRTLVTAVLSAAALSILGSALQRRDAENGAENEQ